jgi:hypothetical protein|tara:strand:- start:340 stop:552 length:213 start_codon:yes stop_codon:yes gene_type:complete
LFNQNALDRRLSKGSIFPTIIVLPVVLTMLLGKTFAFLRRIVVETGLRGIKRKIIRKLSFFSRKSGKSKE